VTWQEVNDIAMADEFNRVVPEFWSNVEGTSGCFLGSMNSNDRSPAHQARVVFMHSVFGACEVFNRQGHRTGAQCNCQTRPSVVGIMRCFTLSGQDG
jgi:hypothetical protein